MKIEKRQKFPITNSYPWRCHGIESNPHPEIENYDKCCDFPGCQEKCLQIPYRSKKFALTSVGLIAFIALVPMILDTIKLCCVSPTIFQYGGATAFAPIRDDKEEKNIEKHLSRTLKIPKVDLIYSQNSEDSPGTTSGINMLIDKQLSFAQASRSLTEQEINKAKTLNLMIKDTPVAIDGIAIFINPELNISQLSLEQVRDLFTGKIRNWRELGGPSERVIPISLSADSQEGDTADFFQKYVMQAKPFTGSSQEVKTPTIAMQCVGKSQDCPLTPLKGYISYASASLVCNQQQIKAIALSNETGTFINPCLNQKVDTSVFNGSYSITRKLFIITKQDNTDDQKVGEAYIEMLQSRQGQKLLEEAGFTPISGK